MLLYPKNKKKSLMRLLLTVIATVALLGILVYGITNIPNYTESEKQKILERNIVATLVKCYAIEGYYPQKLSYLEEHYGLIVDHNKYHINYKTVGSNILPTVTVTVKN